MTAEPPSPANLRLGPYKLSLSGPCLIMGILNITRDSFSADGLLDTPDAILRKAEGMVRDGADVLDLGGETAGTSREAISVQAEIDRTAPWIARIAQRLEVPISINSWRFPVVQAALEAGAVLVNDIGDSPTCVWPRRAQTMEPVWSLCTCAASRRCLTCRSNTAMSSRR